MYDLDGTLVDTGREIAHANAYVLSRLGAPPERLDAVHTFAGRSVRDLIGWGFHREEASLVDAAEALFTAYYAEHADAQSRLYPGVRNLLDYFSGRAQAVLTDRPSASARGLLEARGISGYFSDLIAGDSRYPRKPDPAGVVALMANARVAPHQAVLIGDSPVDIAAGRRAGVFTVAVSHGMTPASTLRDTGPGALVEDVTELLELAKRSEW